MRAAISTMAAIRFVFRSNRVITHRSRRPGQHPAPSFDPGEGLLRHARLLPGPGECSRDGLPRTATSHT